MADNDTPDNGIPQGKEMDVRNHPEHNIPETPHDDGTILKVTAPKQFLQRKFPDGTTDWSDSYK